MDNKKTYEAIGNHLDERIKKSTVLIEGIKGELFDVLTLGDDEKSRKEIGGKIMAELDQKLKAAEAKDPRDEKYIGNLKKIISDLVMRMDKNEKFKDYKNNNFINLDKKGFNKEVLDQFAEEIIELSKTSNQVSGALWKRIYSTKNLDKDFYQQLKVKVLSQFKTGKLNSKQRQNLTDIFGYLEEKKDGLTSLESKLHPDPNGVEEKELSSLQKKIRLHPYGGFELTDEDEIKERLDALKKGDEIVFKDGYRAKVTDIKLGIIKLKFLGTPSESADGYSGERERNKNDFLSYPDFQVGNIDRIIVPLHRKEKLKGGLEFKTEEEIRKRLESLQVGDVITFNDGYSIRILDKKAGNKVLLSFHGTPSIAATIAVAGVKEGENWWNLDELLKQPKFGVKDIRQINSQKTLIEDKRLGIELTDRAEIKERLQTLEKGDRITFKDGFMIEVLDKKIGKIKLRFHGTPSSAAAGYPEGEEWWNLNDFLTYPKFGIDDIRQINIPIRGKRKKLKGPDPEPTDPEPTDPDSPKSFEENVVISDVTESYEDLISREVENEINEEWHNTSRYNVFKFGKLWLARGRIRKKRIKEMKKGYQRTPFTNNGLINSEMSAQAARHDLEESLQSKGLSRDAFGKIERKTLIEGNESEEFYETERGKEFKEMCQDYVAGTISQIEFQNKFNKFVQDKLGLPKEQQFVATNVLEKLDAIKNDNMLLNSITADLNSYLNDHNQSHFDAIRKKIDDDFKKYKRDPRFRKEILNILGNTQGLSKEDLDEKINKFIKHEKALAKMSTQNLKIKLDLLTNGKGAYQTNNKDRENRLYKFGHKLDKMPRWGQALTIAGISASGIAVGLLGGSALAATATLSGLVGAKNFIKKWTHHTKEQNTYEKNLTRNYEEEIAKMKKREKIRTEKDSNGKYTHSWFKRYKAKRELELYGKTTQAELQNESTGNTKEISTIIFGLLDNYDSLSPDEKNALNCTLMDGKARLETYWNMGHNFLKSKDKNQIERDFYELENALTLGANRIMGSGATLNDIALIPAYDASGKAVNYNDLLNLYKKDYNSATKKFKGERAWLATKWGLGTAAFTFGTAAATQAITHTGMFAKDAVAGTPGTPETHETFTSNARDHYGLGKWETDNSEIFRTAQDNISNLDPSSSVRVHLSSGTDGTQIASGSSILNPRTYEAELNETIQALRQSNISNKAEIIQHLEDGLPTSGFTNHTLYSMRDLNAIEQIATGSGNFSGKMEFIHDVASGVDGQIVHDAGSRFTNAIIEITNTIPGTPGTEAIEAGKKWLVVGLPRFSNTFKRKNEDEGISDPGGKGPDQPKDKPGDQPKDKPGDQPKDKPGDQPKDKPGQPEGPTKGPSKGPGVILPPVKTDDPAGPTIEQPPRNTIKGKIKGVVTRGHPINITNEKGETILADVDDLGTRYPGDGQLLPPRDAAKQFLGYWKAGMRNHFTKEDIDNLSKLNGDEDAQIKYIESQIIHDRETIENSQTMENFIRSKNVSKDWIKKFLPEIVGNVDAQLLNSFLSDDRIHVVSDRDYLGLTGSISSTGCFRTLDGDIYIRYSFIQQTENRDIHRKVGDKMFTYKGFDWHSVLIHEMIHSMSAMNYFVSDDNGTLKYDQRRIGLRHIIRDKNGKLLGETGRSMNEAATESLSWEILRRGFNSFKQPIDISYLRDSNISYKGFINVIDQLQEIDHIKHEDFWKAMLIRKRAKDKSVEWNTPLFELMSKVNGRVEKNGRVRYTRPDYYDLLSNSMDFAHEVFNDKVKRNQAADFETKWIVDFITKKDINILKNYVRSQHKTLRDVFDKSLLTKNGGDFKKDILDTYNGK